MARVLSAALLCFAACGPAQHATEPKALEDSSPTAPTQRPPEPNATPHRSSCDDTRPTNARLVTSMVRSACFGSCPAYEVAIYADGTVDYRGLAFVAGSPRRVTHVDVAVVDTLAHDFEAIGFASLPDYRSPAMTDTPTLTMQYGRSRVSLDAGDPAIPPGLIAIASEVDALARVVPSKARGDAPDPCPLPATLAEGRVIQQVEEAGELRLLVAVGSNQQIAPDWEAYLLTVNSNQVLADAKISEVRRLSTTVTTRATPAARLATVVRFLPPAR